MGGGFVTMARRALVALAAGIAVAAAIRVRGSGGVPPQTGGWQELDADDLN